jgi:tetratricopeptide (TPR) repeat protein
MVLPSSPVDDASVESPFGSVRRQLNRSSNGIIVLVDHARPERLRDLILELLPDHPNLFVSPNVEDVVRLPEGTVVVLVPNSTDDDFLNLNRPIFSRLRLKVVLWCDTNTTTALAQRAVDFFDWISHRHVCPVGVAMHGILGLRAAAKAHARCIWWTEGDLQETFHNAFPNEQPPVFLDARRRFSLLVHGVRFANKRNRWIVWQNVTPDYRADVVALASAEAKRNDRMIIDARNTRYTRHFPVVHGVCWSLQRGINYLGDPFLGWPDPDGAFIAALVGLEPETLQLLDLLFSNSNQLFELDSWDLAKQLVHVLVSTSDPGAALAAWAMDRIDSDELLVLLAPGGLGDRSDWNEWVESGRRWTAPFLRAFAEKNQFPSTWNGGLARFIDPRTMVFTAIRCAQNAYDEQAKDTELLARRANELAVQLLGEHSVAYVESSWILGKTLLSRGELRKAEEIFRRGLTITNEQQAFSWFPDVRETMLLRLSDALADALARQGRYEEAEEQAQNAVEVAKQLGNPDFAKEAERRRQKIRELQGKV